MNEWDYQQRSKPYTKLSTKETLKTILITKDVARTDTLGPIFCVSSSLRLSANRKAKAFCFLILLNTNEKNNLAAGSSTIASIIRPASAAEFPVVLRTSDNYLKDKLC